LEISPSTYRVSGSLAVATVCPCEWPSETAYALEGRILLLPDALCSSSCSAARVICAASRASAKAVLLACQYRVVDNADASNSGTATIVDDAYLYAQDPTEPRDCVSPGDDQLQTNESCTALPAGYIRSNVSALLAGPLVPAGLNATSGANGSTPGLDGFFDGGSGAALGTGLADDNGSGEGVGLNASGNATQGGDPNSTIGDGLFKWRNVNLTMWRFNTDDDEIDCDVYEYVPLVYLLLVPLWWILTVLWTWNTYRANAAYAKDLHRLLCWVPTIQFVHGILSLFNYSSCPWDGTISLVYATFWAVVTILKEPVMLLCLLLVAKGWCITRNSLERSEVYIAGTVVALLYAAVSIHLSLQSVVSLIPMVIMYMAMLTDIATSILANLRILKAQLLALYAFGIDPLSTPVYKKYRMFVNLARFTLLFVVLEAAIHAAFTSRDDEAYWLFILLHQLMELVIAIGIGWTFRAQPFNVMFQQVQQVATELADQLLPTITTVEIRANEINGANLIAWRPSLDLNGAAPHLPATLVVLNPGDEEKPQPGPTRVAVVARPPQPPPPTEPPPELSSSTLNDLQPSQRAEASFPGETRGAQLTARRGVLSWVGGLVPGRRPRARDQGAAHDGRAVQAELALQDF